MRQNHHAIRALLCGGILLAQQLAHAGDAPSTFDVTNQVRRMVEGNSLSIKADTAVFGDPAPDTQKKLKVDYTVDDSANSKVVMEGGSLEIHPKAGAKLAVNKATYGDLTDEKRVDVTPLVAAAVQGERITLDVNNGAMGGDPAPTTVKTLEVTYTIGGRIGKATAAEYSTLTVPQPTDAPGKLVILGAIYGDL